MPRARLALGVGLSLSAAISAVVLVTGREVAARSDRWTALTPAPLERTEVAAARIGHFIYVAGGFESETGATSAAVERYDIRRDRWRRVRPMPIALNHPSAVAHRGRLYVHGGYAAERDLAAPTGALLRYSPSRDRWLRLPSSPTPRAAHAAAVIGDRIHVAGGANDEGSLRSHEVYDIGTRRWSAAASFPFGPARNHTAGVASGGRFYVLAGRDARNLTSAERYDPRRRAWERLPGLRTPRGGIAAARLGDGRIVVLGGEQLEPGGRTIAEVELFDPRTRRWRSLPPMLTPRRGLGAAALGRRVFALAGGSSPGLFFSGATEALDVR